MQENESINHFLQELCTYVMDFSRIPQFQPVLLPIMKMIDDLYESLDDSYKNHDQNQLNFDDI